MYLQENVTKIKGIGAKRAQLLAKLAINNVLDLIKFYPKQDGYIFLEEVLKLQQAKNGQTGLFLLKVIGIQNRQSRQRLKYTNIVVQDSSSYAEILLFASQTYQAKSLKLGSSILTIAKAEWQQGKIILKNAIIRSEFDIEDYLGILPKYRLVKGLTQKQLQQAIQAAIGLYEKHYAESLPLEVCAQFKLMPLKDAIKNIHTPANRQALGLAQQRLIFEEIFFLQYSLLQQQLQQSKKQQIEFTNFTYANRLIATLPYVLTADQKKVWQELVADFQAKKCLQRLLQGDVGSGKTIIAILALLTAVENGYQAVIVAPTEILARQHYNYFQEVLATFPIQIDFLASSVKTGKRDKLLSDLQAGTLDILVGTHAILNEQVQFAKLALVVVDEQHRFGVGQRQCLLEKNQKFTPHLLVMSATPIPRTLALALYGNLDVSRIESMPAGRKPVQTLLYGSQMRDKVYQGACRQINLGRQVYVVCPLIDDETEDAVAVVPLQRFLKEKYFSSCNCAILHGQMPAKEKEQIMLDFMAGKIQVLISTTVIEVGINVPNATLMIIEGAEFFGLAQLHQLRGRVGRGKEQSFCVLLSEANKQDSWRRLELMVSYSDGFKLAEEDLRLRGAGEMLGRQQHGLSDFVMADIIRDSDLILQVNAYLRANVQNENLQQELEKTITHSIVGKELYQRLN